MQSMGVQDAASGPQAWQTQLQCLLASASLQLPAYPAANSSQQAQPPALVLSPAMLTLIISLADELQKQLPALVTRLKAGGFSQAGGVGELLAKVQWQVVGLVQGLYACLTSNALSSPPRRSLDVKV